ncbi:MAG: hypothetical protein EG826_10250 [Deltaproteobacteria bacterium]|nr:hypothetical protein [Deltaproteobacteria bacterium]
MKRVFAYFIFTAMTAVLIAGLALPAWLFGTTSGAKQVLGMVSSFTGIRISAQKVEGRLAEKLRLENTEITWPRGTVRIERLEMGVRPLDLLAGQLSIRHLSAVHPVIQDNSPDTPPTLIWPRAAGLIIFFSGAIEKGEITNLRYRRLENQPVKIETITFSAAFRNSQLSIGNLQIVSDLGVAGGNLLAGFGRPLFMADLTATPAEPIAGMDSFRLSGKFGPGKRAGELSGNLLVSGSRSKQPQWQLAMETAMTEAGFPVKQLRLTRPGRRGLITADGLFSLGGPEPFLNLRAEAIAWDLSRELGIPLGLSGTLTFAGTAKHYEGRVTLAHQGKTWRALRLAADYSGNAGGAAIRPLRGSALKGTLSGGLDINWQNGLTAEGTLSGRNVDPAQIDPDWTGIIHFDLSGKVALAENKPPTGEVIGILLQSKLHGQELTGEARAAFTGEDIRIARLSLQGKGFQVNAGGPVKSKVDFSARVSDLALLIPQTGGSLAARGSVRWHNGRPSGALSAEARNLNAGGLSVKTAALTAAVKDEDQSPLSFQTTFNTLRYQTLAVDHVTLQAGGTLPAHTLTATARRGRDEAHLALSGAYREGHWRGKVLRLYGADGAGAWRLTEPAALSVTSSSLTLDPLVLAGRDGEALRLSAALKREPLSGSLALGWDHLNLSRINFWLSEARLGGTSAGSVHLSLLPRNQIALNGKVSLTGTFQAQGQSVNIRECHMTVKANELGIRARADMELTSGGTLTGSFFSSRPAVLSVPEEGDLDLHWQGFDLLPLSGWLPGRTRLEGQMAGSAKGRLAADHRFSLTGRATLTRSRIHWRGQKGDVNVGLRDAALDWKWHDEELSGAVAFTLSDYGNLQGRFVLPIAARLPVAVDRRGKLQASLGGRFREKGALGVLLPGLVQESHGDLDLDLNVGGHWDEPQTTGTIRLSNAGGYLPTAGIAVKDARIAARFDKDAIHIDSFHAASGPGALEGSALIRMKGMQLESYEGKLNGERFQAVYFPELQVLCSPRLTFSGTRETLSVRGEILLPAVQIIESQSRKPVAASPDVIREGKPKPEDRKLPIRLDVGVRMILGEQVRFKASGIDAQLGGSVDLQFQDPARITGRGEIRVAKGNFRTYGVNLEIIRGRLFYTGTPINRPSLDILAWRKVGDVHAGVAVSGTLPNPLVKLYSEPAMQDTDILAYIVLGHPLASDAKQISLLAAAAGALLSASQSEDLLSRIKNRLGLGSLDLSTDVVKQNNHMGYKRMTVTPSGTPAADVSETMMVVGKYLTPELYISYGRSLFSGSNLFLLRYDISKSWQVETQTGTQSGVDIYYKLEFN